MRKRSLLAALAVSAAMIAAACGGGSSTNNSNTLLFGDYQDVDSLGPYWGTVMAANVITTTEAGLVMLDGNLKMQPYMATKIPTVGDGWEMPGPDGLAARMTWEIHPWKWSDGTDLTCADFQYWLEWTSIEANIASKEHVDAIDSIDCPSPTTIVVNYKSLYAYMKYGPGFLPKQYYSKFTIGTAGEGDPLTDTSTDMLLGAGFRASQLPDVPTSGPFKFESRTPGIEVVVAKNQYFKDPMTGTGAKLDRIKFIVCGSPETCIAKYRAGELDVVTDLTGADKAGTDDLGDQQKELPSLYTEFLRPNFSADACTLGVSAANDPEKLLPNKEARGGGCPASDLSFRKAISAAVDRDGLLERVQGGLGFVSYTLYPKQFAYWTDQSSRVEPYSIDRAAEILAEGGWSDTNGNGTVDKVLNGKRTEAIVEVCTTMRPTRKATVEIMAAELKEIGVQLIWNGGGTIFAGLTDVPEDTQCNLDWGNFDFALHAFSFTRPDFGSYNDMHSSQTPPNGGTNAQRINVPEIDEVALASLTTVDEAGQIALGQQNVDLITDYAVYIPLHYWMDLLLVSDKVTGWEFNIIGGPLWNITTWELAPAGN
jgi:ABC-type transport system substrate-binding protein